MPLQLMSDSWHEERRSNEFKQQEIKRITRNYEEIQRRKSKIRENWDESRLKGKLFNEIPFFKEKQLKMDSNFEEFRNLLIKEGDCNLAWKYNKLIFSHYVERGNLPNHAKVYSEKYLIKFW